MARILLVEDDVHVRTLMEDVLLDRGYAVDAASSVDGACKLLERGAFDLLVTDGRLPDGTGMIVADRAQEKGIPSLIVTAYAFILDELRDDPAPHNVLLKPFVPNELLEAVASMLDAP